MIRAVFFDFYSVWTPDKFSYFLANAQLNGPEIYKQLYDETERYFHGEVDVNYIADTFRFKLGHPDISTESLQLNESTISPEIVNFIRQLHEHFLKVGILANLGTQEYQLLNNYNQRNQLFEAIASPLSLQLPLPLMSSEVFAQALQTIGEPPESCLFVSGNPYLLLFAKSLGFQVLHFVGLPDLEKTINDLLANDMPTAPQTPQQPAF